MTEPIVTNSPRYQSKLNLIKKNVYHFLPLGQRLREKKESLEKYLQSQLKQKRFIVNLQDFQ